MQVKRKGAKFLFLFKCSRLKALMKAARNHEFECVIVWKFDLFARSVSHLGPMELALDKIEENVN